MINEQRFEAVNARNAAFNACVEEYSKGFKKGDVCYWLWITTQDPAVCHVTGNSIRLLSWGKDQGTAVYLDDSKNSRCRFRPGYSLICRTVEQVHEIAAKLGKLFAEEHRLCRLDCTESNFPNLRPEYQANAAAEIAAYKAAVPSYEVFIK